MKEWVINAHNDYTANYRKTYPGFITIKLGDWSGKTKDGSNVNELLKNYNDFLSDNFSKAMKQIWQPLLIETFFLFITLIWMLLSSFSGFSIFLTGVLGFIVIKDIIKYFITRINLKYEWQNNYEMARKIFHAFCAEYVDWQNAFKKADKVSIEVSKLLTSYKSAEFTANSAGKKIITEIQVK